MIKKLTYLFLKLDYRDREKSSTNKFIGIIIGYFITNSLLSFNYFVAFDSMSYAILSFTINIFLLSFLVLNDFQNLFFAKLHTELLRNLPVTTEELFISKILSAFIYLSIIISMSLIPQTVFFYFYEHSVIKSIIFIFSNYLFSISSITLILILFFLIILKVPGKSNSVIYIFQFIFFAFVMFSSSYASRAKLDNKKSILDIQFVNYLPQKYFALSVNNYLFFITGIITFAVIVLVFYYFTGKKYLKISDIIFTLEDKKKRKRNLRIFTSLNEFIRIYFLKNKTERASYCLTKNQFRNSRTFKLRYVPLIFLPLIFCLIGILIESDKYLIFRESMDGGTVSNALIILSPSIIMTFLMCSRLMVSSTKIADENSENINWIYEILPVENKKLFLRGTQKFIYINLLLPAFIASTVILSFKIEIKPLLLNMLFIASNVYLINSLFLLFDRQYPFTRPLSKYNSASRLLDVFIMMILGVLVFVAQIFIFQNFIFIIISILLIFGVSVLISKK